MAKLKVGIIGSGKIGSDLLLKLLKCDFVEVTAFVGRRENSEGVQLARSLDVPVSADGIDHFIAYPGICDIVYDSSNAESARMHAQIFARQGVKVIDLTPAKVGELCVPLINGSIFKEVDNINLITCGGQSSIPIFDLVARYSINPTYMEMVSAVASKSVGMGTRINVDQYISTTEAAIRKFTGVPRAKVILNINPAEPCIDMQTTLFARIDEIDMEGFQSALEARIADLNTYLPLYALKVPPILKKGILTLNVLVQGSGDFLPPYAGNLDIINCSAIQITRQYHQHVQAKAPHYNL